MKKLTILFLISVLTAQMLTGCGDMNASEGDKVATEVAEEGEAAEAEAESVEETKSSMSSSPDRKLPTMNEVANMFDSFLDWMAIQYIEYPTTDYDKIENDMAIEMAAFSYFSSLDTYVSEDGETVAISYPDMDERMQNMFGRTFNLEKYSHEGVGAVTIANGKVYVPLGDWGTLAPEYSVNKLHPNEDGTFTASIRYSAKDLLDDPYEGEYEYLADFTCTMDTRSPFGFVINDMNAKRTGSLPKNFDPLSVAGVYVREDVQSVNNKKEKFREWIVLEKDGTGYWSTKDDVKIKADKYSFTTSDGRDVPYFYIDDKFAIFIKNELGVDEEIVYKRTNDVPPEYGSDRSDR